MSGNFRSLRTKKTSNDLGVSLWFTGNRAADIRKRGKHKLAIEIRIIGERMLESHPVPGTREVTYEFLVTHQHNEFIGASTARYNVNGVFPDVEDLDRQVADRSLRQRIVIRLRQLVRGGASDS